MPSIDQVSLVRKLAHQLYAAIRPLPVALGVTTDAGAAGQAQDGVRLAYENADENLLNGVYFRIDAKVGSGPASGEFSRIKKAGLVPSTGVINLSPDLTGAIEIGTAYSLHILHPTMLEQAISWALNQMPFLSVGPVSLLGDADMEDTGIAAWAAVDDVDVSKVTDAQYVWGGLQALLVDPKIPSWEGYAEKTGTTPVVEGEGMLLSAVARSDKGSTVKLVPFDYSNNAEILPTPSYVGDRHVELRSTFTVPSGCRQLKVRLNAIGPFATYWDDVVLLGTSRQEIALPSWVDSPEDVANVGYWPSGAGGPNVDTFRLQESGWQEWHWWEVKRRDPRAVTPYILSLSPAPSERIYVIAWRRFPSLSSDADLTAADETAVLAGARTYLRGQLLESTVLGQEKVVLDRLRAMQSKDDVIWAKAILRTGGAPVTRMRGLRKYLAR